MDRLLSNEYWALRHGFADEMVKLACLGTVGLKRNPPPEIKAIRIQKSLPPKVAALLRGFIGTLALAAEEERQEMRKHAWGGLLGRLGARLAQGVVTRLGPEAAFSTLRGRVGAFLTDPRAAGAAALRAFREETKTLPGKLFTYGLGFGWPAWELYKGDIGPAEAALWGLSTIGTAGMTSRGLLRGLVSATPIYLGSTLLGRKIDEMLGLAPETQPAAEPAPQPPATQPPPIVPVPIPAPVESPVPSAGRLGWYYGGQYHFDPTITAIGRYRPYSALLPNQT